MIYIGGPAHSETTAWSLLDMSWIADGISEDEIDMASAIARIDRQGYADISERLFNMQWVADSVSHEDSEAALRITRIISFAPDSAVRLIDMPFLQTIEREDIITLDALSSIARGGPDDLADILAHPQFKDGITDDQAAAIAMLSPFPDGAWLIRNKPDLAYAMGSLPWVADGVEDSERDALALMLYWVGSSYSEPTAWSLLDMPWVADGISEDEIEMASAIARIDRQGYADISERLFDMQWVVNGVSDDDSTAAHRLFLITLYAPDSAARLVDMPFLQSIEQADVITLDALSSIARGDPDDLADILARPQFKDGIMDDQATAIAMLSSFQGGAWLIRNKPDLAYAIGSLPWVADGVEDSEREALELMLSIDREGYAALSERLVATEWLADGVSQDERFLVRKLLSISRKVAPDLAVRLMDMPFLQTTEQADHWVLSSLLRIASESPDALSDILAHPQYRDGITDAQTIIVVMLSSIIEHAPHQVDKLLDPSATTVERKMIELPISGEVELAIVRTYLKTRGTLSSMNLLENSVREVEKLMDAPLPYNKRGLSRNAVWLLFENALPDWAGGVNRFSHITIRPEYDLYAHIIAHEVAHYYWFFNADWLDEGMAEVMASVIERERVGSPVKATNAPCGVVESIMELEALAPEQGEPGFRCNYSLGEGLFLDLLQQLGEDAFWDGVRGLHATSQLHNVGVEDVRQAFGPDADAIISRWYGE